MDYINLKLNEYQASNLYWLLCQAIMYDQLHTGDWNQEVLYELSHGIFKYSLENGIDDLPIPNGTTKGMHSWKELTDGMRIRMLHDVYMHFLRGRTFTTENVATTFVRKYKT